MGFKLIRLLSRPPLIPNKCCQPNANSLATEISSIAIGDVLMVKTLSQSQAHSRRSKIPMNEGAVWLTLVKSEEINKPSVQPEVASDTCGIGMISPLIYS